MHANLSRDMLCSEIRRIYRTFILSFLVQLFLRCFCMWSNRIRIIFKQIHTWDLNYLTKSVDLGVMTKRGTPYFIDLQNWNLTIRCRLVSYPGNPLFFEVELILPCNVYCKLHQNVSHPSKCLVGLWLLNFDLFWNKCFQCENTHVQLTYIMISKFNWQIVVSEFDSHWVLHNSGIVPHLANITSCYEVVTNVSTEWDDFYFHFGSVTWP